MLGTLQKLIPGIIALAVTCIAIELIPISKQAYYWNRCLKNTYLWTNQSLSLKKWSKEAKEALAVGVCNGAVYETKLKTQ